MIVQKKDHSLLKLERTGNTYLFSGSGVVMALVTEHIFSRIHLLSPCRDRPDFVGGLGGFEEEDKVMGGLPRRGDSGGGVSQLISDTGEPLLM